MREETFQLISPFALDIDNEFLTSKQKVYYIQDTLMLLHIPTVSCMCLFLLYIFDVLVVVVAGFCFSEY
jgi:hypothetical protein